MLNSVYNNIFLIIKKIVYHKLFIIISALIICTQIIWLHDHNDTPNLIYEVSMRLSLSLLLGFGLTFGFNTLLITLYKSKYSLFLLKTQYEYYAVFSVILLFGCLFYPGYYWILLFTIILYGTKVYNQQYYNNQIFAKIEISESSFRAGLVLFIIAVLIIIFRDVRLLLEPRLWAEDGKYFLQHFYNNRDVMELLKPFEYYRILHNLTSFFSIRLVSLTNVPMVFTVISLIVQCIAIAIICFGYSEFWDSLFKKSLICTIIIFAPTSEEIWFNLNGSSYFLSLITALILLVTPRSFSSIWSYRIILSIAGLMGVLSCLLTPLYGLRAFQSRNRENIIQFLILTCCVFIQLGFLISNYFTNGENTDRTSPPTFYTTAMIIWIKTFSLSIDLNISKHFSSFFLHLNDKNDYNLIGSLFWLIITAILAVYYYLNKNKKLIYLIGAYLLIVLFSSYFGLAGDGNRVFLHPLPGNRYFYTPNVLLGLILISPLLTTQTRLKINKQQIVPLFLSLFLIYNGVILFYKKGPYIDGWPKWSDEIKKWEKNPKHRIAIWPPPRYFLELKQPD